MAPMKFGWTQLSAQTPKMVTRAFTVILYGTAAFVIILTTFNLENEHLQLRIIKVCGGIVFCIHQLSTLFGVKPKDPPAVENQSGPK